jgi:PhoH-like ATPase
MRKIYVLDTSVLAYDPNGFKSFTGNDVIIPVTVLDELDKLKKGSTSAAKNARLAIRALDEVTASGEIHNGISIDGDITLKIDTSTHEPLGEDPMYGDNRILATAKYVLSMAPEGADVILVSKDINLRTRARAYGMQAEDYEKDKVESGEFFRGIQTITNDDIGHALSVTGHLVIDHNPELEGLHPNECVYFEDRNEDGVCLGRRHKDVVKLIQPQKAWGLNTRNKEQQFAVNLLLDVKVPLVTLIGMAGTGKSLMAVASALEMVIEKKQYSKIIIYRPIQPVGNDIGYLPGSMEEKLGPWMGAMMDSFEVCFDNKSSHTMFEQYCAKGIIEMNAITYIRGRSIPNAYIIVDECFPYEQNIATETGKTRIGILYDMWKDGKELPLVKSFNTETNEFEFSKITHAWNRGEKDLVKLTCGNREIKCTENHKFLTENGWKEASRLEVGELIKTSEPGDHQILHSLNEDQEQIMIGSFLGDGSVSNHGKSRFRLRVVHGIDQSAYCGWKADMFNSKIDYIERNGYSKKPAVRFASKIFGMNKEFPKVKSTCPQWVLDKMDARGLAIWFMDDGNAYTHKNGARISTCSFDEESQIRIVDKLKSFNIDCDYAKYDNFFYINLSKSGYLNLCSIIKPYIHKDIEYKVVDSANVEKYNWNSKFNNFGLTVVDSIVKLEEKECVYDIEVEKNHNFIVASQSRGKNKTNSGLIAHNCQNLTKEDVKTILTRAGEGTKIVLTGDIEQIDNSYLDALNNGLTYVVEKFKDSELAGHVTFAKGERSPLATEAARIL